MSPQPAVCCLPNAGPIPIASSAAPSAQEGMLRPWSCPSKRGFTLLLHKMRGESGDSSQALIPNTGQLAIKSCSFGSSRCTANCGPLSAFLIPGQGFPPRQLTPPLPSSPLSSITSAACGCEDFMTNCFFNRDFHLSLGPKITLGASSVSFGPCDLRGSATKFPLPIPAPTSTRAVPHRHFAEDTQQSSRWFLSRYLIWLVSPDAKG